MSDQIDRPNIRYHELEKPEFKSAIPAHLTAKLSDHEKYLVETLSKMEQQSSWLVANLLVTHHIAIETSADVEVLKEFKRLLLSKWTLVVWFFTVSVPVALKLALEWMFNKRNP